MTGYVGAFDQSNYTLHLEASLIRADGVLRSQIGRAQVLLYPISSSLVSVLNGPSGDVLMSQDLVLETSCNDPDDFESVLGAFGYQYVCVRGYEGVDALILDDKATRPCETLGKIDGNTITFTADDLIMDVWYIYTFTCSKDSREHASTLKFRPRSADSPIPTGKVTKLCAGSCQEKVDPNQDVLLMAKDLFYQNTDVQWSCSNGLTKSQVKGKSLKGSRLTLLAGSFPELPMMNCVAEFSHGGKKGESRISLPINARPYCSMDGGCSRVEVLTETNEYPLARFMVSAPGFVDDQNEALTFMFGCQNANGSRQIFYKGKTPSYELGGLQIGKHSCFVCAIDAVGSETCETLPIDIAEPASGITEETFDHVLEAVRKAIASGDVFAVVTSIKTALSVHAYSELNSDIHFRRLLATSQGSNPDALAVSFIAALEEFDPFVIEEFLPSASELATLSESVSYETLVAIARSFVLGLEAADLNQAQYTKEEAFQLTIDISKVLTYLLNGYTDDFEALDVMQLYVHLLQHAENTICKNLALGQDAALGYSLNGNGISISCKKDDASSLEGTNVIANGVDVQFSKTFNSACTDECPSVVEMKVTRTDNTNLHLSFLDSIVPIVGIKNAFAISPLFKIAASDIDSETLCKQEGCALNVTVPLSTLPSNGSLACVRIEGWTVEGLDEASGVMLVTDSYSIDNETVKCEVTKLGVFLVVEYEAFNVEGLSEDITMPENVTDTLAIEDSVRRVFLFLSKGHFQVIRSELRFALLDFAVYSANATKGQGFKAEITRQLRRTSSITGATFVVVKLKQGSLIAVVEATLPADTNRSSVKAMVNEFQKHPEMLFDTNFVETYGLPEMTVKSVRGTDMETLLEELGFDSNSEASSDGGSDDGPNLVAIIVPVVLGTAVLGGLIAFLAIRFCKRSQSQDTLVNDS